MARDRWDQGGIESGSGFAEGFKTPLNVKDFSHFAPMQTIPSHRIPATMSEQMDGDQNTDFTGGRGKKR